jgi:hypothetical protein
MIAWTAQIQEPPSRFAVESCVTRVAFYDPDTVSRVCGHGDPATKACYWNAFGTIVMPSPWRCGTPERCQALWRHEVAHACGGWKHEP